MKRLGPAVCIGALILIGLAVRAAYFTELTAKPTFASPDLDAAYHDYFAREAAFGAVAGQPRRLDLDSAPYFRPPGYIYFLTAVYRLGGPDYLVPRAAQFALGILNSLLVFLIYRKIFGPPFSCVCAALTSVYWVLVYYEGELIEPTLMTLALLLLVHLLLKADETSSVGAALLAGVVFGAGCIIRPNLLLCIIPVLGWIAARPRALKGMALVVLGSALVVAPVTLRNYLKSGQPVLVSANAGVNLYAGNNENSDGYTPGAALLGLWDCFEYPRILASLGHQLGHPVSYAEASSYFSRLALEYARNNPGRTLKLIAKKTLLFWGPREVGNEEEEELERAQSKVLAHLPGSFPAVLAFLLIGAAMAFRRPGMDAYPPKALRGRAVWLILLLILFYYASFMPFIVAARYRAPLIPLMMIPAVAAAGQIFDLLLRRRGRAATAWIAAGAVLTIVFSVNYAGYRPNRAKWHSQRAAAFGRAGLTTPAIRECEAALLLDPQMPEAHAFMGNACLANGDMANAMKHYLSAALANPMDANSRNNLAYLMIQNGYPAAEALPHAEKACELVGYSDPSYLDTLAEVYARLGRRPEALQSWDRAIRAAEASGDMDRAAQYQGKKDQFERGQP